MTDRIELSRREAIALAGAATVTPILPAFAQTPTLLRRKIPQSNETLPVVGVGTAIIFDFPRDDAAKMAERAAVMRALVDGGGSLIDTAPSYGEAEARVGDLMAQTGLRDRIFIATKVRVADRGESQRSLKQSQEKLRTQKIDLMQLHNVRSPDQDLAVFREWKQAGLCRYIGITSSFDRDYGAVEACLRREKPDFFQIDYSMVDRNSEERLIPAAKDAGAAVLTNLPFGRGKFFQKVRGKPVPDWAAKEIGVTSWAQFALKWLLGHEAITAVIPGTDKPEYMLDNLKAGQGALPDAALRKRMIDHIEQL